MRPSYKQNEKCFNNPQPGDHWHEMFVPYFIVLECLDDGTFIICEKCEEVDNTHWRWDIKNSKQVEKSYFNRVKYGSIEGFVADVSSVKHTGFVAEWNHLGRPFTPLSLGPSQVASDFRTVMEQGV